MMVTRDRLVDLKNNVNYKTVNEATYLPLEIEDDDTVSSNEQFKDTFREIAKIRQWITDIDEKTQGVVQLCKSPMFHISKEIQNQIDANVVICAALGTKISGALREFQQKVDSITNNDAFSRIIRVQYLTMRQSFIKTLEVHENCLKKYKNSKLSVLKEQIKLTNHDMTEEECLSLIESNNISIFVDNIEAETREAQLQLRDVEIRHKELIKIENALIEVQKLFVQMARLINQQQNQIDTVEYYATQAYDHVQYGNRELVKGSKNRKKSLQKKIYLCICLITGCSIVLAVLILT